uniref:Treacle protein n=1 Tax=Sphenodon punctatus TaxID=8508 RepID=A0A8D0H0I1_SPHPU
MAAAGGSDQKELLALIHQHLVQTGYGKAARALLLQSGQKEIPSPAACLEDIFSQWKNASPKTQKLKTGAMKVGIAAKANATKGGVAAEKIRVPDPKSSSESSEEEETAKAVPASAPVTNNSATMAESSDDDDSSEEEPVTGKEVKTAVVGGNAANSWHNPAPNKASATPGKLGTSVQAKVGQNKAASSKLGPAAVGQVAAGQNKAAAAATTKKAKSSESSSLSESEEEMPTVKLPAPKPVLKQPVGKAESSSEESSDSDSEEEEKAAMPVQRLQTPQAPISTKPSQAGKAVVSVLKGKDSESSSSSERSSSSDSEDEEIPASQKQPLIPVKKTHAAALPATGKKAQSLSAPLPKAQEPEGSSQDSSEESSSEEEAVASQKPAQVQPKPAPAAANATAAKHAGAAAGKVGSLQSPRKQIMSPAKVVAAALKKAPASSESDSTDSSESEEAEKLVKQMGTALGKTSIPTGKSVQANSIMLQNPVKGKGPVLVPGKGGIHVAAKVQPGQSQATPAKAARILKRKESAKSSDSSDSEKEAAKQPTKLGAPQKLRILKKTESSSEESSEEDEEPSQSLLAGYPGLSKSPAVPAAQKMASLTLSKPVTGKAALPAATAAANRPAKPLGKAAPADISTSNSSDSEADAGETPVRQKAGE